MENKKLVKYSLIHSLGVFAYISLVSWVMQNGERLFGKANNVFGGVAVLLLFVVSATVVGLLVLGKPALLYLDGKKTEALKMFFYTLGWLASITIIILVILSLI